MSKKDNVKEPNEAVDQAASKDTKAEETQAAKEETTLTVEEQLREDLAKEKGIEDMSLKIS